MEAGISVVMVGGSWASFADGSLMVVLLLLLVVLLLLLELNVVLLMLLVGIGMPPSRGAIVIHVIGGSAIVAVVDGHGR